MGTLVIRSTSIMNVTFKASLWMITFHTKYMDYQLINGKINSKEDMISLKLMTYTISTRMGTTTLTMDTLALKIKFHMVQVNHGSEK